MQANPVVEAQIFEPPLLFNFRNPTLSDSQAAACAAKAMQMPSTLQDQSLNGVAQANEICAEMRAAEEEMARANIDAVFELACRIIVMKSLPAWIDEIRVDHL